MTIVCPGPIETSSSGAGSSQTTKVPGEVGCFQRCCFNQSKFFFSVLFVQWCYIETKTLIVPCIDYNVVSIGFPVIGFTLSSVGTSL